MPDDFNEVSNFDQQISTVRDRFPAIWWAIYQGCMAKGFSEAQAMELTKTYIMATFRTN